MQIALRNNIALICLNLDKLQECVVNCNHALEFDKKNIKALFKKAKAKRLMQNFEEAQQVFRRLNRFINVCCCVGIWYYSIL